MARQKFGSACDWSRTRAFAIPDSSVGLIRVNLQGREPAGVVAPARQYEQTVAEVEEDLRALRDPRTGDPVIERVARTRGGRRRSPAALPRRHGHLQGPRAALL